MQSRAKVDPITLSVVRGVLETTQREMTLTLEKTGRDFSNGLQRIRSIL